MSLGGYLRSNAVPVACDAAAIALLALLLPALGVGRDATALACLATAVLLAIPLVHGWLRERAFLHQLKELADLDEGALDAATALEEPGWPEGDLAAQALAGVARDGRRQLEETAGETSAYRRYVEAWVHEVKTPLAAMRLFLANHHDPGLRPLRRELDRVDASVEQALYYARSLSVDRDLLVRPCPLDDLVREAVRGRSSALIEAHMTVGMDGLAVDGQAPEVPCDPKWMAFVLGQLVDNAVRYRADPARDGRTPRIEFSARTEGAGAARAQVLLDVRDNGCGIAAADLPRVFDRGFTGDNGRTHAHSTGMGLYLVRRICERMGLAVTVDSQADAPGHPGWTCVTVAFPAWAEGMGAGGQTGATDGWPDAGEGVDEQTTVTEPAPPACHLTKA